MNKHTVLGLNDAEHKIKQLCGELTRRSRIAAGGHSCTPEGGIMLRSNMSGGTIYSGGLFLP